MRTNNTKFIPIHKLTSRSAIRRKKIGVKNKHDIFHTRSIDLACQEFFKERGLRVFGSFNDQLPAKS